ncbi:MAG: class I SAM-dependent methyltransferase [Acidimicrobiales bacterium]
MGLWEQQVVPRVIDKVLGNEQMAEVRVKSLGGLHGTVVEIGFGSGPNVPLYPEAVTRVLAIDPSGVARRLAEKRVAASSVPVEFVGLDGQHIDLPDDSADCALSTWTLCTIPDAGAALAELRRVVRPGGELFFLEHGRSPRARTERWQHRLDPVQRRLAGGCNLSRDIPGIVSDAGFDIERVVEFDIAGPKVMSHMYSGIARNPA